MNSRERLEKCIAGETVDRPPVALWRHFPTDDRTPATLARSIILFQNTFGFDFVKITPASSYSVQDWGSLETWDGNPEGSGVYSKFPIEHPQDWTRLKVHSPLTGALGQQLECIRLVRSALPPEIPILPTIFSPLSQAKHLAGKDQLLEQLHKSPEALLAGLHTITEQTLLFIHECKKLNIDGIFFAVQHAQKHILSESEFTRFGMNFDLKVLAEVQDCWLNVGHIHGSQIMFDKAVKYPVTVLNWHDREEGISLQYGLGQFKGAVCGGLRQWDTMAYGTPDMVQKEAQEAIDQTNGKRFILGTGCVLPIIAPFSNIMTAVETAAAHAV